MRLLAAFVISVVVARGVDAAAPTAPPGTSSAREDAGDSRYRNTEDRIWKRRLAIQELERAALVHPRDVPTLDRLGEAYYQARFMHMARVTFGRALALDSSDANAHFGLGRICQRDWLATPVWSTLGEAERHFEDAVRARPEFSEAWVALATLRFESRDPWTARQAAMNALSVVPRSVEAELAAAYLAYRTGQIGFSDSLFTVAIPRCPQGIAARFSDITPLLTETEQMRFAKGSSSERAEFARRFWSRSDPDPTTPQNEARLEFWARLAHALLLIGDPWSPRWLARTDLYSRYGRLVQVEPDFGSRDHHEMPFVEWGEIPVTPSPEALHGLTQNTIGGDRAVFAPLPPGATERPLESLVSRFEGPGGPRLAMMVETPGTAADSIVADCVVIDSDEREVARATRVLSPSACDPAEHRAGEFAFEVPPGRYRLALAVRDALGGRGVAQADQEVARPSSRLALSDLVLACDPSGATSQGPILLNPNLGARVNPGQPLYAYFEVYHLSQDAKGGNRLEYEYTVREVNSSPGAERRRTRVPPRLAYGSAHEGVGSLRRQFITIPAASLPPGRYRLTIAVHDQLSGAKAERWVDFVKAESE